MSCFTHLTSSLCLSIDVGTGQAEPIVGVGSHALPTPTGEYGSGSGELGGLLDGGGTGNTA